VPDRRRHHPDREPVRKRARGQIGAAGRDDRARSDEDQRERADELREPPLEGVPMRAANVRSASDGSFEGSCCGPPRPTYLMSTAVRKAAMSAEILKRKLRNFPVASLSERIGTS